MPVSDFDRKVSKVIDEAIPSRQRALGRELTSSERFAIVRRVRESLAEHEPVAEAISVAITDALTLLRRGRKWTTAEADAIAIVSRSISEAGPTSVGSAAARAITEARPITPARPQAARPIGETMPESRTIAEDRVKARLPELFKIGARLAGRALTESEKVDVAALALHRESAAAGEPAPGPTSADLASMGVEAFRAHLVATDTPQDHRTRGGARESVDGPPPPPPGSPQYVWDAYSDTVRQHLGTHGYNG